MHPSIHGFRTELGTRTAIMAFRDWKDSHGNIGNPVYTAFLDIKATYDSVDRSKLLSILKDHGVGGRVRTVLASYWNSLQIIILKNQV